MIDVIFTAIGHMVDLLNWLILARCILSWFPIGRNPITSFIYSLTEPILAPLRKMLYNSPLGGPGMMLDFSPIIACFILSGVYNVVMSFVM